MDSDDIRQEIELIKLQHPKYLAGQIYRDLRDRKNSCAWSDGYKNKLKHISLDVESESDPDLPRINVMVNQVLAHTPFDGVEVLIDLYTSCKKLTRRQQKIIALELSGVDQVVIAKTLHLSTRTTKKERKNAVWRLKKLLC
jgi:hypothetical protein